MLSVRLAARPGTPEVLAIPVAPDRAATSLGVDLADEIDAFLAGRDDHGRAGAVHILPRPLRVPAVVLLVGIGDGDAHPTNLSEIGAGSVMAALYLPEFTGAARDRWAHVDMSAPSWADGDDGELVKGATGWGARTLLRWLANIPPGFAVRPKP